MIVVRPYTVKDSIKLSHTINMVCANSPWMSTQNFIPTKAWLHAMEMDNCRCHRLLIAEKNGGIIGWCRSFPVDCKASPFHAELGIGLLPRYRNQGIGFELTTQSMRWAKTVGLQTMDLTVSTQNSIAVHVFTKCGFEPVNTDGNRMRMSVCLS
jgi:RimJ/RimL family protein N-acetyltransferase